MAHSRTAISSTASNRARSLDGSGIARLIQNLFGRDEIVGSETLGKAVVHRLEASDGFGGAPLMVQQAGEAGCSPQFP